MLTALSRPGSRRDNPSIVAERREKGLKFRMSRGQARKVTKVALKRFKDLTAVASIQELIYTWGTIQEYLAPEEDEDEDEDPDYRYQDTVLEIAQLEFDAQEVMDLLQWSDLPTAMQQIETFYSQAFGKPL